MEYDEIDWKSSLDEVLAALGRSEWQVRARAVQLLTGFGDQFPLDVLTKAVIDEHKSVRVAALETCATLSYRVPIKLIEIGLRDSYWSVRAAAAWACSAFGEEAPLQSLLTLLDDPHEQAMVRASALYSLGTLKGYDYRERMIKALYDVEQHVREVAAFTLGKASDRSAISSLIAVSHDEREDVFVRAAAIIALGQMQEDAPKEVLMAALDSKEQDVRDAALEALETLYGKTTQPFS